MPSSNLDKQIISEVENLLIDDDQYAGHRRLARFTGFKLTRALEERRVGELVENIYERKINEKLTNREVVKQLKGEYGISILFIIQFTMFVIKIIELIQERRKHRELSEMDTKVLTNEQIVHIYSQNQDEINTIWELQEGFSMRDAVEYYLKMY